MVSVDCAKGEKADIKGYRQKVLCYFDDKEQAEKLNNKLGYPEATRNRPFTLKAVFMKSF